jgi:NAD(P)-dependent dehydrogenase (short-subunit alcohol dehydrogenase family)
MMPAFQDFATKEVVDQAVGPIGRYARAEEQAWPLVMVGSPRMSYVGGEVLAVDGGFQGARYTGRHQADWADQITES